MEDCLISRSEAARLLQLEPRRFDRLKAGLIALCGLKETVVGSRSRYLKSSVISIRKNYLTRDEVAKALDISLRTFERFKNHYIVHRGIKEITIGRNKLYTRSSVEKAINNAVHKGKHLGYSL